jgi:hypothetical protein
MYTWMLSLISPGLVAWPIGVCVCVCVCVSMYGGVYKRIYIYIYIYIYMMHKTPMCTYGGRRKRTHAYVRSCRPYRQCIIYLFNPGSQAFKTCFQKQIILWSKLSKDPSLGHMPYIHKNTHTRKVNNMYCRLPYTHTIPDDRTCTSTCMHTNVYIHADHRLAQRLQRDIQRIP